MVWHEIEGYWAVIHKEEGSVYGVSFPDLPGCISAGDTLEEAVSEGQEALSTHIAWLRADRDPIPQPRKFEELRADPELAEDVDGAIWQLIYPQVVNAPRTRVNIMVDPGVLRQADQIAQEERKNRSEIIEAALLNFFEQRRKKRLNQAVVAKRRLDAGHPLQGDMELVKSFRPDELQLAEYEQLREASIERERLLQRGS